jgi:hypothetical protein
MTCRWSTCTVYAVINEVEVEVEAEGVWTFGTWVRSEI